MKTIFTTILFFIITTFTIAQSSLDSGIVAFYPFNGNANDESGNGNDGTIANAVLISDRFNQNDGAYYFNGSDARIEIPGSSSLNIDNQISISAWVKPEEIQTSGDRMILGKSNYSNATNYIFRIVPNGYIQWEYAPSLYTINNPLTPNTWYHVVLTSDSTIGLKQIFINGDLIVSQVLSGSGSFGNVTNPLTIGAAKYFGTSWAEFFKGSIDDVRIFNRILNDTEILTLYQDSTTFLPGLIDSVYPHQNSNYFQQNETIKVFFSQPMDSASIVSANTTWRRVYVHGSLTGKHLFDVSYLSTTNSLEIFPTTTLKHGELITVSLDSLILTASGNNLTPFVFQFNVKPEKGTVKFAVADSFQLNFSPTNIISGDFNNDGKVDVIVSNYDSSKYTILLNNGSGGFILGEEMTGEFKPYSISFTDIDNDRDLDMIVSTNEQNKIRLLRGTGQGIFGWILPYIDVNAPVATCPGDFDGDGDNDFVALLNYGLFDGRAYLYKNDGTGSFTQSGYINIGFPASQRNVVGDFDNDGDLDLVVGQSEYNAIVRTLINDGTGNFVYYSGVNLGAYPDELAGGDFDGDFDLDIIHCAWYANGLGFMLNDSTGSFTSYLNLGNVGGQSRNPVSNDFDGDADLDFVVNFNNNNLGIVKNNGYPDFELNLSYPITGLKGITAADFDNNGSVDIVGISSTTNQIKFLKNCVDSLVAYLPFDNDTKDYTGNINDGINYNGIFSKDRYGNDNSSIYLNAVDSYVEGINPGNNLPVGNSPRTFSAWIRNNQYNQYGCNIFHYGTQQAAPTNFHFLITDVLGLGNGYGYGVVYGSSNIIDSTWHFVTGVYEGGTERITKLYVDGKLDASGTISTEPNTILGTNWRIGRFMEGSSNFKGNIDELKVYDIPFTNQQVWDMYKSTTTAPKLLYPNNDSTLVNNLNPILDWDSTVTASNYRLIMANDSLLVSTFLDTLIEISSFYVYDGLLPNIDNIFWKVRTINDGGIGPWSELNRFQIVLTDVKDETQLPKDFALLQNYPNPFNPSTKISYQLPVSSNVTLKVFDVLGNEIATLVNEEKPAGFYEVNFNSNKLASGVYMYKIQAGVFVETRKMILIR